MDCVPATTRNGESPGCFLNSTGKRLGEATGRRGRASLPGPTQPAPRAGALPSAVDPSSASGSSRSRAILFSSAELGAVADPSSRSYAPGPTMMTSA